MAYKLPAADMTIAQLIDGLIAAAREVGQVLALDEDGAMDPTGAADAEQAWKAALSNALIALRAPGAARRRDR